LRRLFGGVLTLLVLATVAGLVLAASRFRAASPGSVADYWEYLCGVQLPGFTGHDEHSYSGGVYPEVDGRLYYYEQHHHHQELFVIGPADVLSALPLVRESLDSDHPPNNGACTESYRSKCAVYENAAPRRARCRASLMGAELKEVGLADLERLRVSVRDEREGRYRQRADAAFRERIARARRLWLTLAFEAVYLAAWLSFVAWPLFAPSRIRWYWRAGLAPFLLFLPYFLGYAPMTFTFGPSGGFLYPAYLLLAALPLQLIPCSAIDRYLGGLLPEALAPLSQVPGSPAAASYVLCVGPASSLFFGVLLVVSVSLLSLAWSNQESCRQSQVAEMRTPVPTEGVRCSFCGKRPGEQPLHHA
jgi:hypothetical protein